MNLPSINKKIPVLVFLIGFIISSCLLVTFMNSCSKAYTMHKKVIVLGIDGMDPRILTRLMNEGKMPNFKEMSETGSFRPLTTSIPPQSPVAWSNFITGMDPGGHGIFDFIHRDPETFIPYLSTSKTTPPERTLKVGKYLIPLSSGNVELLRKGKAFWEILEENGVPCTIIKIPANFPPVKCDSKTLAGMGTPDILGNYGTFSFFTEDPPENKDDISGGEVYQVYVIDNQVDTFLTGPKNTLLADSPNITVPFSIYIDPKKPVVKIVIKDNDSEDQQDDMEGVAFILKEGEWSDWVQVRFDTIPHVMGTTGICKFYLKQVRPKFQLYVTPINIDPSNPALPISTPENYCKELYKEMGFFYTQGMAEDTKALSGGIFTDDEYILQAKMVLQERLKLLHVVLKKFDEGLLFFYFSSLDQSTHMFWRFMDKKSPGYDEQKSKKYGYFLDELYMEMDKVLGFIQSKLEKNTTLIVMSDHGFAPFYRAFNLNNWLRDNGYLSVLNNNSTDPGDIFTNVAWSRTRAYGLGINSLYINQKGREFNGIVEPGTETKELVNEIAQNLEKVADPETGEKIIRHVYKTSQVYSPENRYNAPDIIVGYEWGYRGSWETALGAFSEKLVEDNTDPWSGDHCVATDLTPGVLLMNRKISTPNPALYDLTVTILKEFGIKKFTSMVGTPIK